MDAAFSSGQIYMDVVYISVFASWLLGLVLLVRTPGLIEVTRLMYLYDHRDKVVPFIQRFISYEAFRAFIMCSSALSAGAIAMVLGVRLELVDDSMPLLECLRLLGVVIAVMGGLTFLRFLSSRLWHYIFVDRETGMLVDQDRVLISLLRMIALMALSLLYLAEPVPTTVCIGFTVGLIGLVQVVYIVQGARRLHGGGSGAMCNFLYLCTHEILPWVYLALFVSKGST